MHGQQKKNKTTTESEILNERTSKNLKKNETKIIWSVKNVTLKK